MTETSSPLPADALAGAQSLGALLRLRAARSGERTFLRDAGGAAVSFAEADRLTDAVAGRLVAEGVGPGDRVALLLPNAVHWPLAWLAVAKLGAIAVPLNPGGGTHDLAHVVRDSGARLVLVTSTAAVPEGVGDLPVVAIDRVDADAGTGAGGDLGEIERTALLNVQYTSGTTGLPKGVMLTHDYWLRLGAIAADFASLTEDDVVLTVQPFYYLDPQWTTVMCLVAGAQLCIEPRFSASRFWPAAAGYGATFVYLIGTMPHLLFKQPEDPALDRGHRLRGVACSGIPAALHADFERRWGVPFREAYGLTETGVDLVMPFDDVTCVGSGAVGRPVAGKEVRLVDDDGRPVPDGAVGELTVRGAPRMEGYWGDPHATASTIRDGWVHTGDLAVRDPGGAFRLVGRKKDMIRRGGENIAAAEVEAVLCEHPEIRAAAVVAVADELRGEEVLAYLQPVGGRVDERRLLEHVATRLAPFKVPRFVRWVEDFPLTPSERIAKHLLLAADRDPREGAWDALA